jgi:hypothetical protein
MVTEPASAAVATYVGVYAIFTVQLPLAFIDPPLLHVPPEAAAKSPLVLFTVTEVNVIELVLGLVIVIAFVKLLLVPLLFGSTATLPKASDAVAVGFTGVVPAKVCAVNRATSSTARSTPKLLLNNLELIALHSFTRMSSYLGACPQLRRIRRGEQGVYKDFRL